MDAIVSWMHGTTFSGVGSGTGYRISIGTRAEDGAPSEGASPMELLLMGTAGCTALDVISILQKKRQDVTAFEIQMHGTRADEHPKVFTHITMEYIVTGRHLDPDAVRRAIDLSLEKYCSAHAMMSKAARIEHAFKIVEAPDVKIPVEA
jgi:putative redox protein